MAKKSGGLSYVAKLILVIIPVTDWLVMGVYRILHGHIFRGILWLLTGGLAVVGWILDIIWMVTKKRLFWDK